MNPSYRETPNSLQPVANRRCDTQIELKHHALHAAEIYFNRSVVTDRDAEEAEMLASVMVMDAYVKSKPYPFYLIPEAAKGSDKVTVYWTEDDEERFIVPSKVQDETGMQPYSEWVEHEVGDMVHYEAGAPGIGHVTYKVTRKDEEGLWGICTEDTMWVPDGGFFR